MLDTFSSPHSNFHLPDLHPVVPTLGDSIFIFHPQKSKGHPEQIQVVLPTKCSVNISHLDYQNSHLICILTSSIEISLKSILRIATRPSRLIRDDYLVIFLIKNLPMASYCIRVKSKLFLISYKVPQGPVPPPCLT